MTTATDILTALESAISSSTSNTGVANVIGQHLTQQNNTATSIKSLLALATPQNASSIASQIAELPGVPATVTPLLQELASATTAQQITTVGLEILSALSASTGELGSFLSSL